MVEEIKHYDNNVLAVEVKGGFTEDDEKQCQKLVKEKMEEGYENINVLVKLDEMKLADSSIKAFFQDAIFAFRNYKKLHHLAVVAKSKFIETAVKADNLFFRNKEKDREEKYFDVSEMNQALKFVGGV